MTHFHIIPDRGITNDNLSALAIMLTQLYEPPFKRIEGRKMRPVKCASWDMRMEPGGKATFALTVPRDWEDVVATTLRTVWPRATVTNGSDILCGVDPAISGVLELREHYMFRLRVDKRTNAPLSGLLDVLRLIDKGEVVVLSCHLTPAPPDWWEVAADAYESFRHGRMPQRVQLDAQAVGRMALKVVAGTMTTAFNIVEELMGCKPTEFDLDAGANKARALREGPVGTYVPSKLREQAFEVTIRVAVQAPIQKAKTILRAACQAFRELDADNALTYKETVAKQTYADMRGRKPKVKINHDYMCCSEVARLMQLPSGAMQDEYRLPNVALRETDLPKSVTSGGMRLGVHKYHGTEQMVYMPTSNHDELCLPHVVIGGMGTGKSTTASNIAIEAVANGFGVVVVDPARGEIGDAIEGVLGQEKVVRYRFGEDAYSLDWREAFHSDRGRNRLASELIAFCEAASDEAGAQTVRYLRAAAKAVPTGKVSEVVKLFTDSAYLSGLVPGMREAERLIWTQFIGLTDARRAQIAMPVLNRLDVITGDDYLNECLESDKGIDLVSLLDTPRCIVFDLPKGDLGAEAVDVLASLLATKIDLAMVTRRTTHPVFVIMDEPHQYMKAGKTWRSAVVESRKWRFAYCWMFHAWEQLSTDVRNIIQAAGPHYHLLTSSKATYSYLKEEIAPFTVEEAMGTPRHFAINVIRSNGVTVPPFIAKMLPPPTKKRLH